MAVYDNNSRSAFLKIGFALNTSDKIKLSGVRWIKPVSTQMNVCFLTAVASRLSGLFASFFMDFI